MRPHATCMLSGWHEYTRAYTMPPSGQKNLKMLKGDTRGEIFQASLVCAF